LGLPVTTYVVYQAVGPGLAGWLPPGAVYLASAADPQALTSAGSTLAALAALGIARVSLARCDEELRHWYDRHHGVQGVE
jgi:hypothetical protein